jgi:hypothetical protein
VTPIRSAPASATVKVKVLVHQSANRFQPAQVNPQAYQRVIAVAVQSVRVKAQVIAHRSAIQDRIALV